MTVEVSPVRVEGTAPAGAEVVQDISFAGDERTTADTEGDWTLFVDLEKGRNELVFRLGDDDDTATELVLVYEPETTNASPESTATQIAAPVTTEDPTAINEAQIARLTIEAFLGAPFIESPLADGTPRWMTDPDSTEALFGSIELIGEPELQKATALIPLTADISEAQAEQAGMVAGAIAGVTADFSPWFSDQLTAHAADVFSSNDWSESTSVDEWNIRLEYLADIGILMVTAER